MTAESTVDERALVEALRAGEEWAYETLIRTYGGRLLAVARRYTRDESDAHDIVQSAYLNAFRAIGNFQGDSLLCTWLHRIVVNTALMRLRSRKRKPEESIEPMLPRYQPDGHHEERFSSWAASAEELMTRAEVRAQVRAAIDRLPESYRTVLLLRDIDELTTQEVSDLLGLTTTTVKVRLHRARQALAKLLTTHFSAGVSSGSAVSGRQ